MQIDLKSNLDRLQLKIDHESKVSGKYVFLFNIFQFNMLLIFSGLLQYIGSISKTSNRIVLFTKFK